MEKALISGGKRLEGTVRVSGSKNAALPILAATLLTGGRSTLFEVPALDDVQTMLEMLKSLGAKTTSVEQSGVVVDASGLNSGVPPYEIVRKMRASTLVMGPLLARTGKAKLYLPGGCAIGARPIDLHLKGLEALGAKVTMERGIISVNAKKLLGARVYLDYPSVGATENIMMAASLARGTTLIENAAEEPEVRDLARFLSAAGARISGAGTNVIRIDGVQGLQNTHHTIIPDRIEAGTYLLAGAITEGDVLVENVVTEHLKPVFAKLEQAGATLTEHNQNSIRVTCEGRPAATDFKTMPYPGFPTDMQPPFMALLAAADGVSIVTENVFENRFMHVPEMRQMGAHIVVEGRSAIVRGTDRLSAARMKASDLRAGAALCLLALRARGVSEIAGLGHIDRGYDGFIDKLRTLGADAMRLVE